MCFFLSSACSSSDQGAEEEQGDGSDVVARRFQHIVFKGYLVLLRFLPHIFFFRSLFSTYLMCTFVVGDLSPSASLWTSTGMRSY